MPHMPHPRASLLGITLLALGLASCADLPVNPPQTTPTESQAPGAGGQQEDAPWRAMTDEQLGHAVEQAGGRVFITFKEPGGTRGVDRQGRVLVSPATVQQAKAELRARGLAFEYEYQLTPTVVTRISTKALAGLRNHPLVDVVEPVLTGRRFSQVTPWNVSRVNAPQAWATTTGSGIRLLVIDSGAGPHEDLAVAARKRCAGSGDFDNDGHGTLVSGVAAAVNNSVGVVGVSHGVSLYVAKDGDAVPDIAATACGVEWGRLENAFVMNISSGWSSGTEALTNQIRAAYNEGRLVVAAAGNNNGGAITYPANLAEVIAVGSTTSSDTRAGHSNVGPQLELMAPGVGVYTTGLPSGVCGNGTYYTSCDGTSFASPAVAAVAALVKAANPGMSNVQVRQRMNETARDLGSAGWDSETGYGLVDAQRAVGTAAPPSGTADDFSTNTLGNYTIYNTPGAWSISGGFLNADASARQSVVIRNGTSIANGFVETETDQASDGGLVLRFQSSGNYYLMAVRDDSRFGYANVELYRASSGSFTRIAGPVDLTWTRGVRKSFRFEANGSTLKAYVDGAVVLTATDATYASGGFGLRHDNTRGETGITSRFDLLRWGSVVSVDNFDGTSLSNYTLYNTTGAWSMSGGWVNVNATARQSVAIRNSASIANGYVETETDQASDGGLVLRFQSNGNYYLMALRDDSRFGYANVELYRASSGSFTRIAGPVDLTWTRGTRKTFRFQASGSTLTAYVDGTVVLTATDATYTSGGFGMRHDNTRGETGITSRFDLLRWIQN